MARHVALLRAINVGGRNLKMEALREHCEALGLAKVETFIASGNVIFESRGSAAALEKKLEAHLRGILGYDVATFIRSAAELGAAATRAESRLRPKEGAHVGFLKAPAGAEERKRVAAFETSDERFEFDGREIYWFSKSGIGQSKFNNTVFERIIRSPATFRNVTTVRKLADKYV